MRIMELGIKEFGPFRNYRVPFVAEDPACVLLTGKNNEGKTSIINALRLVEAATRVVNKKKQEVLVHGNVCWRLLLQDTEDLLIGRMVHNYQDTVAEIEGRFSDGFSITVYVDPGEDMIYADFDGRLPDDVQTILGFIPPLGPLAEGEDLISKPSYLKACLNTSLAPRHLRNHLFQLLEPDEYAHVKRIINDSWDDVILLDYELNYRQNRIYCYYKESRIEREIAWAGQGLQVWFQIVTHLVRLRSSSVLVLDEPEINLHPEKQNDLVRIIRQYYGGSVIVATHSIELMNNVNVSHIIHVQKRRCRPLVKSTKDRAYLDLVRSEVGSNFNLIASQFEEFELIVFTEDVFDFSIITELAVSLKVDRRAFNIPIHGFSEYKKAFAYKQAYELLIGKNIPYTLVLDRDYYPDKYLASVRAEAKQKGIRTVFTPGKEIENLFLAPRVIKGLLPTETQKDFSNYWDKTFEALKLECYSSYIALNTKFTSPRVDPKTVTKRVTPRFEKQWVDATSRHLLIGGKMALHKLRSYYRANCGKDLSDKMLVRELVAHDTVRSRRFVKDIYQLAKVKQDK